MEMPRAWTTTALERRCDGCVATLNMFVEAYGAEAGNLAVRFVATGGVFVGGGIAPKILPALANGLFMRAFRAHRFDSAISAASGDTSASGTRGGGASPSSAASASATSPVGDGSSSPTT